MSRPIKEGDIVDAHYTEEVIKQVEVLSMPAATGDMLYLKGPGGIVHAINMACSSFEGLVFKPTIEGELMSCDNLECPEEIEGKCTDPDGDISCKKYKSPEADTEEK